MRLLMNSNEIFSEKQLKKQIQLEEIKLLYGGSRFSYTAAIVIALIIYYVLKTHVTSEYNLSIWLGIILSVMLIRSIDTYLFTKSDLKEQQNIKWRIRFFVGTGIAGICWGLLPWLGYSSDVEYFAFIIVCLVGVIAGSLSTLSYRWETMVLFLLPASLLLIFRLIVEDQTFSKATSFVLAVFIFFSLSAGKRIFNNTQQNIRLRLEADNREHAIELMHQKQALHLQNTPLAIIEFDIDLCVTEWNKSAESIFGYQRDEALNENILRLILPRDSSLEAEKLWQRLLNYEAVIGAVIENKTKNGEPIFCEWFITPLTDDKNNIAGIAAMALDITDKKHNELAIMQSKDEAEKANQAKSDFLSNMSHELRTPLNAILGFTQLLSFEKQLTEKQLSHISEINSAGNLLLKLVNQILDLAKIEKGHLQLSMEQVNLSDVFKECRAMIAPLAEQKGLTLNINIETNGYVIADYTRLKQVILNLLSNAIKYNKNNGSVSLMVKQKENDIVRICIMDTGTGISEDLLQEIFQPFNRLNAACHIEGTGIGLSISKQLIEMMRGKIGVTSKLNEGSDFWIELSGKLNITTAIERESQSNYSNTILNVSSLSAQKILVAEDNPTNQVLIKSQLESLGYAADLVKNGQEALNKLINNEYQLLITDCNMPLIDGYQLAKTIRDRGNNKLPIIALTADAFPEKRAECLKAGMNEQLTKPVDLETLKTALEKLLHQ
ncbi:MAG: response regulator [Gammaproteobacteria bacterium]|nr:response regulator [Gammaproteobacteria bacterium]